MKLVSADFSPDAIYSSALEAGDYLPHFYVENSGRKCDLQMLAGEPLLLVCLSGWLPQQTIQGWLKQLGGYSTWFFTAADTGLSYTRLMHDAAVFRLFMQADAAVGVFLCDANLKLRHVALGDDLPTLVAQLPAVSELQAVAPPPPPILVVPDVITATMAQALIDHFDTRQDTAFVNTGDYKSRRHLHPAQTLEQALDDKLCKSLLPEIRKVFFADISHRETYKVCCYDGGDKGTFGKHRDTIDPHLHRRYAMTLVLNDDYQGGGLCFPEYGGQVIEVPQYAAVIFPGSLYHQVTTIGCGRRYVVVSFFFTEVEARLKSDAERFRFRVRRDQCGLNLVQLWPESD